MSDNFADLKSYLSTKGYDTSSMQPGEIVKAVREEMAKDNDRRELESQGEDNG